MWLKRPVTFDNLNATIHHNTANVKSAAITLRCGFPVDANRPAFNRITFPISGGSDHTDLVVCDFRW